MKALGHGMHRCQTYLGLTSRVHEHSISRKAETTIEHFLTWREAFMDVALACGTSRTLNAALRRKILWFVRVALAAILSLICSQPSSPAFAQALPNIYYFPHLALGGGWQTTLTYSNYSPETVTCTTTFYSDSGAPLSISFGGAAASSRTDTLGPGTVIHTESTANLSAPEVRGWAKAQCSGPIKASLLFRFYQQGQPIGEAGVNAMTTLATKFVSFSDQLTGVAYANPSTQTASITITAFNTAGATLASKSLTLAAGAHDAANMGPFLGLSSFRGSIQIESTVPIASLSLNAEAFPAFSSLPPGELDGSTALTYYFPHLALGAGWQTTLTYLNYSSQAVTCTTTFYADSGAPLSVSFGGAASSSRTDTLVAGGVIHDESKADLNAPEVRGWAKAQCSGPIKSSLLFRYYQQGKPIGEAGVNAMTTLASKFVTFADQLTGVAYANPSTQSASITFIAISSDGVRLASKTLTLAAGAHDAANMGPFLGLSSFKGWIQVLSTVPIISLALNAEAFPAFSSLPPGELDASTVLATGIIVGGVESFFGGPPGGTVRALAVNPANAAVLYAGTVGGGVFKSTNGGSSWTAVNTGLTSLLVLSLAIDPTSSNTVYAGTIGGGVFKTTDGGAHWSALNSGFPDSSLESMPPLITSLAIDRLNPLIIYAGIFGSENDGVYKSTNAGQSWSRASAGLGEATVLTLAMDPADPAVLYAGTSGGVFKTTDRGQSWTASNSGLSSMPEFQDLFGDATVPVVLSLGIGQSNPSTIYAGTLANGIFKTIDGGLSWTTVSSGLPKMAYVGTPPVVGALAVDPANAATVYAGVAAGSLGDGVYKSTNGGQSWTPVSFDAGGAIVLALAVDPSNSATVFAGTFGRGVLKSTNSGSLWTAANSGLLAGEILALARDSSGGTIYAGTANGLFKSTNAGQSWASVTSGIANSLITAVAVDPANADIVYAGTGIPMGLGSTGIFKSTNGGASWAFAGTGLSSEPLLSIVTSLAVDPSNPAIVYAGTLGGVYKSANRGASWQAVNAGLEDVAQEVAPGVVMTAILGLAVDPSNPGTVYVSTGGEGIFRSTDSGQSWTRILEEPNDAAWTLAVSPSGSSLLYAAAAEEGIFKTTDRGATWTALSSGLTGAYVNQVAIDPANPAIVYAAASYGAGIVKTTDSGQTWTRINSGLPVSAYSQINALALNPSSSATAYVSIYYFDQSRTRVFKTTNGGQNWIPADSGLPTTGFVGVLAIDPANASTVYAGTSGGVYKSTNGGTSWAAATTGLTTNVNALAIDRTNPATIYAGAGSGVYKSTNSGQNWTAMNSGLPSFSRQIFSLAIDSSSPSTIYAGTAGAGNLAQVFKSTNGGQSWTAAGSAFLASAVIGLAIDPANSSTVYAGTDYAGLFKSTNGGQSWTAINSGLTYSSTNALAIDPVSSSTLYVGTYDGLFKSTDGGQSWTPANTGDIPLFPISDISEALSTIHSLSVDPANADILYAGTFGGGVYKSTDGGKRWSAAASGLPAMVTLQGTPASPVAALLITPSAIYAGTFGSGVFKSTDGGATWKPTGAE
ncbi:MAG: hypothetical protein HY648_11800 [Acidobacteria bacterium]|nr:hypothetical protein [Acidobacteriota bacterium]